MTWKVLSAICLLSILHAAAYIVHQQPDWKSEWTDQGGYRQLGAGLAASGKFTREPNSPQFLPESIRTPGYPLFVAAVYVVFGTGNDLAVVGAQALVFAGICLAAFALARRVMSERAALFAAALTAAFSPIPYFGALVLTEIWATFLLTVTVLACQRARESHRTGVAVAAGMLAAATALTRPVFVLLPFALFGVVALIDGRRGRRMALVAVAASVVTLTPWFAYNYTHFNRVTVSPANGLGRAVWEASWQGVWDGRLQSELTSIAESTADRGQLDAAVSGVASTRGLPAGPMLEYVHQWQDIRAIWTPLTDRFEWMLGRIKGDQEYFRVGMENAWRDPWDHLRRRFTRGLPVLWITEIPYRHSAINQLPVWTIRVMWTLQAALLVLAAIGAWTGLRSARWRETLLLTVPFLYITAVHGPLLTEARQSLPGMPAVIVLAAAGMASRRRLMTPQDASAV